MIGRQVSVLDIAIPRLILKPKPTGKRKKHRVMLYREHKPVLVPIDESPEDKLITVEDTGNIKGAGESTTKEEDESYYSPVMKADVNTNEAERRGEVDEVDEADEVDEIDEIDENGSNNDKVEDTDLNEDDEDDDDEEEDEDDEDEDTSTDGSDDGDDLCDFLVHDTSSDYDEEAEYQDTFYSDEQDDEEEYYYNEESAWSDDEELSEGEDGAYFSEDCEENV